MAIYFAHGRFDQPLKRDKLQIVFLFVICPLKTRHSCPAPEQHMSTYQVWASHYTSADPVTGKDTLDALTAE